MNNLLSRRTYCQGLLLISILFSGCGPSITDNRPARAKVEGHVTIDGQTVEGAMVRLYAQEPGQPGAVGKTDDSGHFLLTTFTPGDGALPGQYMVTVSKSIAHKRVSSAQAMSMLERGQEVPPPRMEELLPKRYKDAEKSGLTFTVQADQENKLILELEK